ncbi:hypothetical protein EDB84DRAFT_1679652, partial [Lactarius hengduanensis]
MVTGLINQEIEPRKERVAACCNVAVRHWTTSNQLNSGYQTVLRAQLASPRFASGVSYTGDDAQPNNLNDLAHSYILIIGRNRSRLRLRKVQVSHPAGPAFQITNEPVLHCGRTPVDVANRRYSQLHSDEKNGRNALATAEDRTPATQTCNGTPAEGEPEEEESSEVAAVLIVEVDPTFYKWILTIRHAPDAAPDGERTTLSFSVPASLLPTPHQVAVEGDLDRGVFKLFLGEGLVLTCGLFTSEMIRSSPLEQLDTTAPEFTLQN